MKKTQSSVPSILAYLAALLVIPTIQAAPVTWTNITGGNWSVGANWSGGTGAGGIPGPSDDVTFADALVGNGTTMDQNFTIDSLSYSQDNGDQQTTTINQGLTLHITDGGTGNVLSVGSTTTAAGANGSLQVPVAITGPGTLSLNGSGNLLVYQGNTANSTHMAKLDLSGLATLNATVGELLVGTSTQSGAGNRPSGTLLLAQTDNITLTGTGTVGSTSALQVQFSENNAQGSVVSLLELGQVTDINVAAIDVGGAKGNGTMEFNSAFSTPTFKLRNSDGASPVTLLQVGDDSYVTSGNNAIGIADFSLGSVDAQVATVYVAHGNPGPGAGTATGTLNLGAGTLAVSTTMIVGYQISSLGAGGVTGTVNVENNGAFASGATLSVGGTLVLAQTNVATSGTEAASTGTVNVNSGATLAANTIVAGGGASSLTVNGTMWLTNTAGTLALPIKTFSPGGATLNLPASTAGAAMSVSNLNPSGSSQINITTVPGIASYPATNTLINYVTGNSGGGNFTLGSLPAASPSYVGTILDTGNGVVQLKLTQGPVAILSETWTGAGNNNNWDTTSDNWLFQGSADNFFAGATCLFNDTSTVTNINLTQPLSPGSVTVNNTNDLYTFEGTGNIAGSALLAKQGPGRLILDHSGVDNFQAVTITGALQLGNGDTNGALSTLTIADNGALVVDSTAALTLGGNISGSGSISNVGAGILTLSGSNTYNGPTVVTNGTLVINGTSAGAGAVTTTAGTILAGGGGVNGAVTVGGELSPGPLGGTGGVFTASNGLTLATGATVAVGLSPTDTSSVGSATIAVDGDLTLNNNQVTVNFSGPPQQNTYAIMTYTGTLSGTLNPVVLGTHYTATVDTTSTPGTVNLTITGDSGALLDWAGTSFPADWDTVTTNWVTIPGNLPSLFYAGDSVVLDDTSGVAPVLTIPAGVSVSPTLISNNSGANSFTIAGPGKISGPATLVKTNTSTLTISSANTFTGPVDIQQGTIKTANALAFGATSGVTVENGATLDVFGQNLGGIIISASGPGSGGSGAIYNSGGANNQNLRNLVLQGDITLGGTGMWEINNSGGTGSISSGGNAYSITKVGNNNITFANLTTFDGAISNLDIQSGILEFSGLIPDMGNPLATNIVESGGELAFQNGTVTWSKNFDFTGNGSTPTVEVDGGGYPTLNGNVQLSGECIFNVTGLAMQIDGPISGTGGLIKNGNSPLTLEGANTYTGDTTINTGILFLSTNSTIADSTPIDIGATLDVSQRSDDTLTLASGQTLEGTGTLNGSLIAGAGSVVAPGNSSVGTLTVTNTVELSGTTSMGLDQAGATNSVLASHSSITYGGVLSLTYLNGSPASGSSFKLFRATSYGGSFSSISPTIPGPGQTWDTSLLHSSGIIRVSGGGPSFTGITHAGSTVVIHGTNGTAGVNYYVLSTTNLATPLTNWTRVATNSYDGSGNFSFTNNVSLPAQFFILENQ